MLVAQKMIHQHGEVGGGEVSKSEAGQTCDVADEPFAGGTQQQRAAPHSSRKLLPQLLQPSNQLAIRLPRFGKSDPYPATSLLNAFNPRPCKPSQKPGNLLWFSRYAYTPLITMGDSERRAQVLSRWNL